MKNTSNYNLPLFESGDKFNKETINETNAKIDLAIGELQETINTGGTTILTTQEVVQARNGKENLKTRIDEIESKTNNNAEQLETIKNTELFAKYHGIVGSGEDESELLNTLLSVISTMSNGFTKVILNMDSSKTYRLDNAIRIDVSKVAIHSNGCTFDFSNADVNGIELYNSLDPEKAYYTRMTEILKGINIKGSGANSTKIGLLCSDTGSKNGIFEKLDITGFNIPIQYGSNTWCTTFNYCNIFRNKKGIYMPQKENSSEKVIFNDCTIFNQPEIINIEHGTGSIFFKHCSLDYFTEVNAFKVASGSKVVISDCHIESNAPFPWFLVGGENINVTIDKCFIGSTKDITEGYLIDSNILNSYRRVISVKESKFRFKQKITRISRDEVIINTLNNSTDRTKIIIGNSVIDNGSFENDFRGWQLAKEGTGVLPVIVENINPIGSKSCDLSPTGGWANSIKTIVSNKYNGQTIYVSANCKSKNAKKVFNVFVNYINGNGDIINSISFASQEVNTEFKRYELDPISIVPIGCEKIEIGFKSAIGWEYFIDDIQVCFI